MIEARNVVKTFDGFTALDGATHSASEGSRHTYEYDATVTPPEKMFASLSAVPDISDVELVRAPIEAVIAELYRKWQSEE